MELKITVTDDQLAALTAKAAADGMTLAELVQAQMEYYLSTVLMGETGVDTGPLAPAQALELQTRLFNTKAAYLAEIE